MLYSSNPSYAAQYRAFLPSFLPPWQPCLLHHLLQLRHLRTSIFVDPVDVLHQRYQYLLSMITQECETHASRPETVFVDADKLTSDIAKHSTTDSTVADEVAVIVVDRWAL